MMPFLYPPQGTPFPILVIANQSLGEDDDDDDGGGGEDDDLEEDYFLPSATILSGTMPIPMPAMPPFLHGDDEPLFPPIFDPPEDPRIYRLRLGVDGFQPNEINIAIRHGRLVVRGKQVVRAQSQPPPTLTTTVGDNDDAEPDFVAKEFKRTFAVPPNADIRKAHAQFCPQQQLLLIDIPFRNTTQRARIRAIDVLLTVVTLLLMDRAMRITYEHFVRNEQRQSQ